MTGPIMEANPEEIRALGQSDAIRPLSPNNQNHLDLPYNLRGPVPKTAPRDNEQAASYLRFEHNSDSHEWFRKCLILQRTARGIPALAPTALTSSLLVPESERVHNIKDWRRGMVGFSENPNIPDNEDAGHVFYVIGRNKDGDVLTWTNDARGSGHVDVVRVEFYEKVWGHRILFGATWLNGYDFADFNKPPKPERDFNTLGDRYENAIEKLEKIRHDKHKKHADKVVAVLDRDIARMKKHLERFAS